MTVHVDFSNLRQTRWRDAALRFVSGGLVTAATGIIAKKFGPGVGGLFLAYPAILPASATLIEKHEKKKKERAGLDGTKRARGATSMDAAGAARGSLGLLAFALVVWQFVPAHTAYWVLGGATLAWWTVAISVWWILRQRFVRRHAARPSDGER